MLKKSLSLTVIICFVLTTLGPLPKAQADLVLGLPAPGSMVNLSPSYEPVMIKGLTVHKDNPFLFDFIVDVGQDKMSGEPLKKEGEKLIKYFLASLSIPDKDRWVNLSPYEKDRMVPEALGQTDMGRDLLAQDYILKQMTASLIYPEKKLGQTFWNKVYAKSQEMYGTTQIPVNTFNKVWIMADKAEVFEHNQTAFVTGCHLKVMLEEDYLALQKHSAIPNAVIPAKAGIHNTTHSVASFIVKQIILPQLEGEVNTGKNFANLRQIFNSVILSTWYEKNLKEALLNQVYANKSRVKGINLSDPTVKDQIYDQYLKAYKKGVFNYIKKDIIATGKMTTRKYFSGGAYAVVPSQGLTVITNPEALNQAMANSGPLVEMDAAMETSVGKRYQEEKAREGKEEATQMMNEIGELRVAYDQHPREVWRKRKYEELEKGLKENLIGQNVISLSNGADVWTSSEPHTISGTPYHYIKVYRNGVEERKFMTIGSEDDGHNSVEKYLYDILKNEISVRLVPNGLVIGDVGFIKSDGLEESIWKSPWLRQAVINAYYDKLEEKVKQEARIQVEVSSNLFQIRIGEDAGSFSSNSLKRIEEAYGFLRDKIKSVKLINQYKMVVGGELIKYSGLRDNGYFKTKLERAIVMAYIVEHRDTDAAMNTMSLGDLRKIQQIIKHFEKERISSSEDLEAAFRAKFPDATGLKVEPYQHKVSEKMLLFIHADGMVSGFSGNDSEDLSKMFYTVEFTLGGKEHNLGLVLSGVNVLTVAKTFFGKGKEKATAKLLTALGYNSGRRKDYSPVQRIEHGYIKSHKIFRIVPYSGDAVSFDLEIAEIEGLTIKQWMLERIFRRENHLPKGGALYRLIAALYLASRENKDRLFIDEDVPIVYFNPISDAGKIDGLMRTKTIITAILSSNRQIETININNYNPQWYGPKDYPCMMLLTESFMKENPDAKLKAYELIQMFKKETGVDVHTGDFKNDQYSTNYYLIGVNGQKALKADFDRFLEWLREKEGRVINEMMSEPVTKTKDNAMGNVLDHQHVTGVDQVIPPGGIDLNTSNGMQWKIAKDGRGVEMNVNQAMIDRVRRQGIAYLSPRILRVMPITSIWLLMGLQAPVQTGHLIGV